MNLLQLAPFALMVLLSVLSSLPIGGESTPYSLRPVASYTLERATEGLGVDESGTHLMKFGGGEMCGDTPRSLRA